jgi:hypothetical protein
MRDMLKRGNLEERDCATAVSDVFSVPRLASPPPPLPSPRFAPHRTLLGDKTLDYTTVHNAAFSRMSDSGFIGETEGSSQFEFATECSEVSSQPHSDFSLKSVIEELSARVVKSASVNRRFMCNIWSVRLL